MFSVIAPVTVAMVILETLQFLINRFHIEIDLHAYLGCLVLVNSVALAVTEAAWK